MSECLQYACERYHFRSLRPDSCLNRQKIARLYPQGAFRDCLYCEVGAKIARDNGLLFYAKPMPVTTSLTPKQVEKQVTIDARKKIERGYKALGFPDLISCLRYLYVDRKIGTIEIAKALGFKNSHFLRRVLTENGIKIRKPGATRGVTRDELRTALNEIRVLRERAKAMPVDQLQMACLPPDEGEEISSPL